MNHMRNPPKKFEDGEYPDSLPFTKYQNTNNYASGYGNEVQPRPIYNPPQADSKQGLEINTGRNENRKGSQKSGTVRAANSAAGCAPSPVINRPQKGRIVINTGGNTNFGGNQERGDVEFGNIG